MKIFAVAGLLAAFFASGALAQQAGGVATPSLWDPDAQPIRPDLAGIRAIRFLTDDDYPPLNFALPDGSLAGFNIDIARAICTELQVGCTIQARRWDTLIDSLLTGKGDALIASLAATSEAREKLDFTKPYYRTPARFATRRDSALSDVTPSGLAGKTIGVVANSAHKAYLDAFFPKIVEKTFPDLNALRDALKAGAIDAAFADGLSLAVWFGGTASGDCCVFRGGPFLESRFFGEGVGVALRKDDVDLRHAIDWALASLAARGVYAELYLKYFPIGFQ
ncbi:MAG TPA: transporter substrate-binding domain-containing protein [Roseiarcus sp.]|nr:transporter substrate-binding domain-containing protein [Roseiarcus sp.]